MTTYGNKMWNNATDNDKKTVVPLKEKDLLKLCRLMDNAGMNYYAFSQDGNSKIAFNTKDLDWFKRIMGKEIADRLPYQQPARPYTPPEKNIIGNVNYRYIPQKSYFKADPDIALKMAEIMERQGIEFSGRIYSNGTAKLTVSRSDLDKLSGIQNDIIQMRKPTLEAIITVDQKDISRAENIHTDIAAKRSSMSIPKREKQQIIGNMPYKDIIHKEWYSPDITPERYNEIKPYLDEAVKYSGLIRDKTITFTSERDNLPDFIKALTEAENRCDYIKTLQNKGFNQEQITVLDSLIQLGDFSVIEFLNERYSSDDLIKLAVPLTAYANATEYERMADKNGVVTKLLDVKQELDDNLALADIYSAYNFNDEQKKLIAEGFHKGLSNTILEQIDESFTADQITTYFDMYDRAVKGEIDPHDVQVYLDRGRFEETLSPTDTKSENIENSVDSILSATNNIPDDIRKSAKKSLVVNLYGGPGAGKSTAALQLVAELKKQGFHAEYVSEVAKELVYAKAFDKLDGSLENQKKIFAEQKNRLDMIAGNVDVAVTDSPLMLNTVYLKEQNKEHLSDVLSQYNEYNNFNILISRDTSVPFENEGRIHNLEESMEKDGEILSLLESSDIEFERFDRNNIGKIAEEISHRLSAKSEPELTEMEQDTDVQTKPENGTDKVHSAFEKVIANHDFGEKTLEFLNRAENQMKINGYTELDHKMFSLPAFQQAYGRISRINDNLFDGKLKDIIREINENIGEEKKLKQTLSSENTEKAVPTITCEWSESNIFEDGKTYSVFEFDRLMKQADDERIAGQKNAIEKYGSAEAWYNSDVNDEFTQFMGYDKTKFTVNMPDGTSYTERQDIGDGFGGVIDFLSRYPIYNSIVPELKAAREIQAQEQSEETKAEKSQGKQVDLLNEIEFVSTSDSGVEIQQSAQLTFFDDVVENAQTTTDQSSNVNLPNADDNIDRFRITDISHGEGGEKTKFKANIEAIQTLKQLEAENRPATADEKDTLSKYVGWGGLQNAFDSSKENWVNEYVQLKELLTDKEYSSARASTLDAFYTSPVIIDGIYNALDKFGFEGGNILEPALGVGNFIGRMPEEMSKHTKFYGTELDSISGRIAQKLYPNADIKVEGFEKNEYQDGCFDVAVGNVPFGDLSFKDDKHGTNKLHDYFFAETLDKVKDGGIVAFVTSTGTLDKKDESVRKMLSEKADLIGAVRLPSGAFKANAGTDVTSDIIFLQKRSTPQTEIPDWIHIGESDNGLPINKYFADNPDMILGELAADTNPRSSGTTVLPFEGVDLKEQLSQAVNKLNAVISGDRVGDVYAKTDSGTVEPPKELRTFSLFEKDNNIYFKTGDKACEFKYNRKTATYKRAKAFIELRDTTRELLAAQERNRPDSEIKRLQDQLNDKYDDFYKNYGLINSAGNKKIFRADISYNLLTTLEKEYDGKTLIEKSEMFTKRTIKPAKAVEHVDTAIEALTLSVAERAKVDFAYMQKLTDMSKEALIAELKGEIFPLPERDGEYQTKSEYLSGDIRQKLNAATEAAKYDSRFEENVRALEIAMPEPLKAGDIDIKIGAAWVDPKIYEQFMYEVFQTPRENRSDVDTHSFWKKPQKIAVEYSEFSNSYIIKNKRADCSVSVTKNFGTDRINAYGIMESLLNLRDPKITKLVPDPQNPDKDKRVVDIEATKLAQRKAEKIKTAFKEWVFKDPERREKLVQIYNEKFNCIRPREYDGSNLRFPQMNAEIELQEHQKNAVAHALFGGNTLFAHSVGAGKTFEMIASAMESKRLGLCTKSLMVVPNHLTEQIGGDFMKLYPAANILVATKSDFTKANRQKLFSKIATGNYDAVIIGHSQLKMIPVSKERQESILQSQINDITQGIRQYKEQNEGGSFSVKAMERTKKSLVKRLDSLRTKKQDDVLTFEEMGIDKLILDEAHEFKNLFTPTKLQNVSGISSSASEKALDLFLKCQYLDEKTGGKGIIMATGTPLSNSVTELHTMMRYLEYDFLKSKGLEHFDNWVTVFGEQKTDWELAPAGNKFKQRTRIAHYTGLPELMSMFKQVADVRTADTLNLKVPECETHIVNVEATDFQKQLVQELADRADDVQERKVDPTEDNMLRITSDGRKLGLDPRLIDPDYEDNPNTKLNRCVNNVFKIYEDTSEDKLTQIVFCDLGVPHGDVPKISEQDNEEKDGKSVAELDSLEEECDFCVYDDIKQKLVGKGIPENEIAYIHSAKTEAQKSELFDKVKKGEVRVLLGSTSKMGTGTNVQDKLIAVHDLDIPWRPADMEQRRGRIVRQGNENEKVHLYRYVTKGTFDAYSYQTLENKQKFISQIMTSKTPVRKCDDVDQQALSYSEIKALCTGDERIKEKMQLDNEVKELRLLKAEHTNTVYEMQDKIRSAPKKITDYEKTLSNLRKDKEHIDKLPIDSETNRPAFKITIGDTTYTDRTEAAKAYEKATLNAVSGNMDKQVQIGNFQGFPLSVSMDSFSKNIHASLKGAITYNSDIGASFANNLKRLENIYKLEDKISEVSSKLGSLRIDIKEAEKIVSQPFAQEDELNAKSQRLEYLTEELNQAAIEAKKNNPDKKRTNYFNCAKLKKEAVKSRMPNQPKKDKGKGKEDGIAI